MSSEAKLHIPAPLIDEHKTYKCDPVCCGITLNSPENVGVVHLFEVLTKCAQLQNKQAIKVTSLKKY